MTIETRTSARRTRPLKAFLLTAALGLALSGGTAQAGWPAIDVGNMTTHFTNFANTVESYIKQGANYAEQLQRWNATVNYFKGQMVALKSKLNSLGLPQGVDLKEVPEDYMVKEACIGEMGGFNMASLAKIAGFDAQGDLIKQQRDVCITIQKMQNRQYNETVQYLKTTMGQMKTLQKSMNDHSNSSQNPGDVTGFMNDAQRLQSQMESTQNEYEQRMAAYSSFIETQEDVQRTLAQRAMKGAEPSLIGQLGKTAILKAALPTD